MGREGAAATSAGLRLLEQVLNRALELDGEVAARLDEIRDRCIAVEIVGTDIAFHLVPGADTVRLEIPGSRAAEVTIRGRPGELLRHLAGRGGHIEIAGDVELAQQLQRIFAALDPDWEEALAQWIGDVPARSVGRVAAALTRFGRELRNSVRFSLSEYLRYERRVLVDRPDVSDFVRAVDELRDAVERLRARMRLLERRIDGDPAC
jgi:ubiquinone biosynthesis protein UbiJ